MHPLVTGIHHLTALASDPQKNIDFYAGVLGLRLIKKTINFDDPSVYHLYYGNEKGEPGTIITFFPYLGIPKGRKGNGQVTATAFSIPENAIDYWIKRFDALNIPYQGPEQRFDEWLISFEDPDGLGLELIGNHKDARNAFTYGNIPLEFSIKGFYGVTLSEECDAKTAKLLTGQMDFTRIAENENRFRYTIDGKPGSFVDILCSPDALNGLGGYGTVHHVAFATANDQTQLEAREKLLTLGLNITPVIDREYFHSIYFREFGGVLFEIATTPPGFTVDESLEHLGETLQLPPWHEPNRALIEQRLVPIQFDLKRYAE